MSPSKKSGKKRLSRSQEKYPALQRSLNLKTRRYYIEPDYINGVTGVEGKQAIRALTDEEKSWLNRFYKEYIIASFENNDNDLHNTTDKRREIYRENNHRNKCLYNVAQRTGNLSSFNSEQYDAFYYEHVGHLDHEIALINSIEKKNKPEED
jgi:uncharacterized protein YdaT